MTFKSKYSVQSLVGLAVLGMLCGPGDAAEKSKTPRVRPLASVYTYEGPAGEIDFALALKAKDLTVNESAGRDHVVLIDTSASQVGEFRKQAIAVVDRFVASLSPKDRVCLFAIDVQTQKLTDGFVKPGSQAAQAALALLNKRVPLGATNLQMALKAGLNVIEKSRPASIVYVGDGMSTAELIQSSELKSLLGDFRRREIPVHSYAVGPRTDLQLLGILAQYTGGLVLFDRMDVEKDKAERVGRRLAKAVDAPVFYPNSIHVGPGKANLLPATVLPLRADRETIYLGKFQVVQDMTIRVTGSFAGTDRSMAWTVPAKDFQPGNTFLSALRKRAEQDSGLSVGLAGLDLMFVAQKAFDEHVARLVALGEEAVLSRNLKRAEQFGLAVNQLDPGSIRGKALLGAANKLKVTTVALTQPAGNQANQNTPPPDPNAPPNPNANTKQPSLLDNPNVLPGLQPADADQSEGEDRIDTVLRMRLIREQRLTLEVTRAIQDARQFAFDEPETSLVTLKDALGTVVATTDISPDARQQLIRRVRGVIQEITNQIERLEKSQIAAAERQAQNESEKRLLEQLAIDEQEMEQLIDQVRGLIQDGIHGDDDAYAEAEAVARVAVDRQPGNGPAAAALFSSEAAGQLNLAFRMRSLRADRFLATLRQVELSHVPFPDEPPVRWPPAEVWKALTERRKKWASVDLHKSSPSEERIQEELQNTTEIEFIDIPLGDAIEFIGDLHNIPIIIDDAALQEEGIDTSEVINRVLSGIALRSALKIILEPLGLTYVVEDEVMKITTEIAAEEKLQTRVYPVGDLVIPIRTPQAGGLGQGLGGVGGIGGGGGGGGFGGGQFGGGGGGRGGGGGGFGGGGFFSVPPARLPNANSSKPKAARRMKPLADPEIQGILDNALSRSDVKAFRGQAFAQVKDRIPKGKPFRFDNEAIQALKKKSKALR